MKEAIWKIVLAVTALLWLINLFVGETISEWNLIDRDFHHLQTRYGDLVYILLAMLSGGIIVLFSPKSWDSLSC